MGITYPQSVYNFGYKLTYYLDNNFFMWIKIFYVNNSIFVINIGFINCFTHNFHKIEGTYPQVIHILWILLCKVKYKF